MAKATELTIVMRARNLVKNVLDKTGKQIKGLTGFAKKYQAQLLGLGKTLSIVSAAGVVAFGLMISEASGLETAMIGVQKTTNLSSKQIQFLKKDFQELSRVVPVAAEDLGDIGQIAGQLGIKGRKNILEFTTTIAKIATVTEFTVQDAAENLARLSNIFGTPIKDVAKLGAVMNELENNTTAVAPAIGTFMQRLATASVQVGLSLADTAGLSATLIDLGFKAELSGTAVSNTFSAMSKDAGKFGKQMGVTAAQFRDSLQRDAIGTVVRWAQSIKDLPAEQFIRQLEDVGIEGARARSVFTALAKRTDLLSKNVKIANDEFKRGTSLQREFETFMKSTANQAKLAKNEFKILAESIGVILLPVVKKIISAGTGMLKWLNDLPQPVRVGATVVGVLATALVAIGAPLALLIGFLPSIIAGFGAVATAAAVAGPILVKLSGIVAGLVLAWEGLKALGEFKIAGRPVKQVLSDLVGDFGNTFRIEIPSAIEDSKPDVRRKVELLVMSINDELKKGSDESQLKARKLMQRLQLVISDEGPTLRQEFSKQIDSMIAVLDDKKPGAIQTAIDFFRIVFNAVTGGINLLSQLFLNRVLRVFGEVGVKLNEIAGFLKFSLFSDVGESLLKITAGVDDFNKRVNKDFQDLLKNQDKFFESADKIRGKYVDAADGALELKKNIDSVSDSAKKAGEVVRRSLVSGVNKSFRRFETQVQVRTTFDSPIDQAKVAGVAAEVRRKLNEELEKESKKGQAVKVAAGSAKAQIEAVSRVVPAVKKAAATRVDAEQKANRETIKLVSITARKQIKTSQEVAVEQKKINERAIKDSAEQFGFVEKVQRKAFDAQINGIREVPKARQAAIVDMNQAEIVNAEFIRTLDNETLLQRINGTNEFRDQQVQAIAELKRRNLGFFQSVRLGLANYRLSVLNTSVTVARGVQRSLQSANSVISSTLFNMVKGTQSAGDAIKSIFVSIGDSIIRTFTNALANKAVSALLNFGGSVLGFSKGGIVPEDGLAAVQRGELILDKGTVSGLAGKGVGVFGPKTSEAVQAGANLLKGAGGGFLGNQLANLAFGTGGVGGSVGGAVGGGIGFALGGPFGAGVGSFLGTGIIGGIDKIFGGIFGARLSKTERDFGALFKTTRGRFTDPFEALAFSRLQVPGTGSDNIADAINNLAGRNIFPGTSVLRNDGGPEGVDALTLKGFRRLIDDNILTRSEIENRLTDDLTVFKGRFKDGLDFVPFDDFPALLHRGERVLTADENRDLSRAGSRQSTNELKALLNGFIDDLSSTLGEGQDRPVEVVVNLDGREIARNQVSLGKRGFQTAHTRGVF